MVIQNSSKIPHILSALFANSSSFNFQYTKTHTESPENTHMEASFEVEDDVFFADLSKQISLLIMDDDEESLVHCPSVNLQAFTQALSPSTQATLLGRDQQSQIRREMSKGTGVFIPRSTTNLRRNNSNQGRFNANYKYQRPNLDYHNSRGIVPNLKYNNNNVNPSYDSINPRRFGV